MIDLEQLSKTNPLLTHEHTLEPLWGSDTGRNSNNGTYSGTFVGYFSQLQLEFGSTNQTQMTYLRSLFDNPVISVRYLDSIDGNWYTEDFYGTAINGKKDNWDGKYEPFNLTLTAIRKRNK